MPVVTASHNAAGHCRVYVNDVLHLVFSTEKLAGLQSWKMTTRSPPMFAIELTTRGAVVLVEYDHEDVWKAVLAAIDGVFLPDEKGMRMERSAPIMSANVSAAGELTGSLRPSADGRADRPSARRRGGGEPAADGRRPCRAA